MKSSVDVERPPRTAGGVRAFLAVWLPFVAVLALQAQHDYTLHQPADPEQAIAWAAEQFHAAGIELPAFAFDPESTRCPSSTLAIWDGTTIALCSEWQLIHWSLLHELGHVWADANLTATDRTRLLDEWGTAAWNDPTAPHDLRGGEQFADMIVWALFPIRVDDCCTLTPDQMLRSLEELGIDPLWR